MEEDLETMLQERFPDADDEEATVVPCEPQDDEEVLLNASFLSSSDEFDQAIDPELEWRQKMSVVDTYPHAVFSYVGQFQFICLFQEVNIPAKSQMPATHHVGKVSGRDRDHNLAHRISLQTIADSTAEGFMDRDIKSSGATIQNGGVRLPSQSTAMMMRTSHQLEKEIGHQGNTSQSVMCIAGEEGSQP